MGVPMLPRPMKAIRFMRWRPFWCVSDGTGVGRERCTPPRGDLGQNLHLIGVKVYE